LVRCRNVKIESDGIVDIGKKTRKSLAKFCRQDEVGKKRKKEMGFERRSNFVEETGCVEEINFRSVSFFLGF